MRRLKKQIYEELQEAFFDFLHPVGPISIDLDELFSTYDMERQNKFYADASKVYEDHFGDNREYFVQDWGVTSLYKLLQDWEIYKVDNLYWLETRGISTKETLQNLSDICMEYIMIDINRFIERYNQLVRESD